MSGGNSYWLAWSEMKVSLFLGRDATTRHFPAVLRSQPKRATARPIRTMHRSKKHSCDLPNRRMSSQIPQNTVTIA